MISLHVHHVSCSWEAAVYGTVSWWIGDDRGALHEASASGDESEQGASTPMDTGVLRIVSTRRLRTLRLPYDGFSPTCPPRMHDPVHKGSPGQPDRLGGPLRLADGGVRPAPARARFSRRGRSSGRGRARRRCPSGWARTSTGGWAGAGPPSGRASRPGAPFRARRAGSTTPSGRAFWDGPPPTARFTCRSSTGSSGTGRCS